MSSLLGERLACGQREHETECRDADHACPQAIVSHDFSPLGRRLSAGFAAPFVVAGAFAPPRRSAIMALTMAPSRAISVPLTSSSFQLMASVFFSLSISGSMKACKLRA